VMPRIEGVFWVSTTTTSRNSCQRDPRRGMQAHRYRANKNRARCGSSCKAESRAP
jgi:hypothetical protein